MINHIDTKSMIYALTDGIGPLLGRTVRSSYYELSSRLSKDDEFIDLDSHAQQLVIDILALALFYNVVIAPLETAGSLFSLIRKADATHVRLGRDKLTPDVIHRFRRCVGVFKEILSSYKIPSDLLSFPTLKIFITNIKSFIKKTHETLD